MIEMTSTTAAMLYLCLTLTILLGFWGYDHFRSRRRKVEILSQELLVCEFCHAVYVADIAKQVTQCPQCQCFNKNNTYKKKDEI